MDKIISSQFTSIPTRMIINFISSENISLVCSKIDNHISKITREIFEIKYSVKSSSPSINTDRISNLRNKILLFNGMKDLIMDQLLIDNMIIN